MTTKRESMLDFCTAGIAAAAAGWCAHTWMPSAGAAMSGAAGLVVFALVAIVMQKQGGEPRAMAENIAAPLPKFEPADDLLLLDEVDEESELVLETEAPPPVAEAQARIASAFDALPCGALSETRLRPNVEADDNRVVALFGGERERAPSPGELKSRIDAHLAAGEDIEPLAPLPPDASEALSAALRSLRRPE